MKKDIYLRKKSYEINTLKSEIKEIQEKIDIIEKDIVRKKNLYKKREKENFDDSMSLLTKELFLNSLLKEINELSIKKDRIEEILNYKKNILSTLLGEKKAYESFIEKKEIKEEKKENEKENRLANEIYIRKHYNS
ncbi:hypothetical protein [Nitrosophilus kaiyonis]|uniref:hypothetical protein n=1 Tax=Nitrosophilus kaiyonis TaxID=2930200 RepID=UPI00249260D9|nr:hypothetical protein [Nitrosophilus kaiyonis]